jgi:hypothetical protein
MCCCGHPVVNGEPGYKWNSKDNPTVRPVDPPSLNDSDQLLRDEPGRCGGLDSHSHHYRLVKSYGSLMLLVRHGAGDERLYLSGPVQSVLAQLDSTNCYWVLNAIYHAHSDGKRSGSEKTENNWRRAAAEKRIKTRKERGSDTIRGWIADTLH